MTESEVINCAADILQRKVQTLISGAHGKVITEDVLTALMNAGFMVDLIDKLRDIAEAFEPEADSDGD